VPLVIPERIHYALHRVATAKRYADSLHTISTKWGVAELLDACRVLDAQADAEAELADLLKETRS
jgi:hypothetical protein